MSLQFKDISLGRCNFGAMRFTDHWDDDGHIGVDSAGGRITVAGPPTLTVEQRGWLLHEVAVALASTFRPPHP